MTAPSIGAKGILVTAGIVVDAATDPTDDWACFVGKLPDAPSKAVSISDTGGLPSDPKWLLDFPTISILLRSSDYLTGWNKMRDIREALIGIPGITVVNGDTWRGLIAIGNMALIGYDPKDRPMFSANYRLFVEPAPATVENRQPLG